MTNLVEVTYDQTGKSKSINALGMRAIQSRAYHARDARYLLLKAPPASKKSRTLIFVALDKFHHVSADGSNRVGELIRSIIDKSTAHIIRITLKKRV